MIGYGLAFVIGYVVTFVLRGLSKDQSYFWTPNLWAWGCVFMGLNWIASL